MVKNSLWGCSALVAPILLALAPGWALAQAQPAPAAPAQPPAVAQTPQPAQAQEQEDQEDATEVEMIVSTGSFIRGTPEDSALPVTVISREELLTSGNPTFSDLLRSLTEVGNVQGEFNAFDSSGTGAASVALRGLGPGRTVVLMNGRRLADEPQESGLTGGAFQNVNAVPRAALQQVEILKDGGATTYGADAVGGVVNFITRRDLNGVEASGSYRLIEDSDGDYDANILWGKRWDKANIIASFSYAHRSPLKINERDYLRKSFLENPMAAVNNIGYNGWEIESSPGAYIFQTAGNTPANTVAATATSLPLNTPYQNIRPGGLGINAFAATGQLAASTNGIIRDPNCAALGGYGSFASSQLGGPPLCFTRANEPRYLVEKTDNYQVFIDGNYDLTENFTFNSNFLFSRQILPEVHQGSSQNVTRFYCNPLTSNAPLNPAIAPTAAVALRTPNSNCVRNLTLAQEGITTTGASNVGFYSVSGRNPAVLDFMRRHDIVTTGGALLDVFTEAQVRRVAGLDPVTGVYDPSQTPGRVQLLDQVWRPFGLGGNPAFKEGQETTRTEFNTFRTTQTLKGALGKILGVTVDFELAATYSHNYTTQEDKGILVDRLERALNGFASNLNEPDGDRCTIAETMGSRTFGDASAAPTPNVPFTVGAGGGAGAVIPGYVGAGNGCYFLNPFSSAIAKNVFSGNVNNIGRDATGTTPGQVGFVGGPAVGGTAPDYQGYAPGYGLANAPGIVAWLYEPRRQKTKADNYIVDLVFNGGTGIELPGGPINFALGGQYRFTERDTLRGFLNNTEEFPCTFATQDAGRSNDDFNANTFSTCGTGGGGIFTDGRLSGQQSTRISPYIDAFVEFALPVHDRVFISLSGRNSIAKNFRVPDVEAFIPAASIKWQVHDNFALRATASDTFSSVTPPEANQTITLTTTPFGGGLATLPAQAEIISNANTELQPETGFNYNIGMIFQYQGIFATLDYFNIEISGRPNGLSAATIARAITGNYTDGIDAAHAIDCSLPATKILTENDQSILGGRPVVTLQGGGNPCSVPGATLSGAGGVPLSISFVTLINAGAQKTEGVDVSFNWRIPEQIFGGNLTLMTQGTWNSSWIQEQGMFFGAPIGSVSYDGLASTNLDVAVQGKSTLGQISVFRGSAGWNYRRGKHNFNWQTRFVSGASDDRGYEYVRSGVFQTLAAIVNYNPANPAGCLAASPIINPNTATHPLGQPGVGIRPLDQNCNVVTTAGMKIPGTFSTDVTWRYDMDRDTVISVSVNNLFDAEPPFTRLPIAYNSYGALTALGRNLRIGIEKKFN